jgi:hypothetical protein
MSKIVSAKALWIALNLFHQNRFDQRDMVWASSPNLKLMRTFPYPRSMTNTDPLGILLSPEQLINENVHTISFNLLPI